MKRYFFTIIVLIVGILSIIGMKYFPDNNRLSTQSAENTAVSFSHNENFYDEDINVELFTADKNAQIYYTINGENPTTDGKLYTSAIKLKVGRDAAAHTIKAAVKSKNAFSDVITKSYVLCSDFNSRFSDETLIFVLSTDPDNFYDYEKGIATKGKIYDLWLENEYEGGEIPYDAPANYFMTGKEWERDIYVEVFTTNGEKVISQNAGVKVAGGVSRAVDQKSLKLIARKSYDAENGKFKYPFFENAKTSDGTLITEFDRLVLRNGANDREFAGVRDELSQELARQAGFASVQNTVPTAVFLNGEYYGFSWLHENYNEDYLETQFGGQKDNYQIVQNKELPEEGDEKALSDYMEMYNFLKNDMTVEENFKKLNSMVDLDNWTMYSAIQVYIDNLDWPGNNFKAWRYYPSENEENLTQWQDGRWRFLLFDVEFAWSLYGNTYKHNSLTELINGKHQSGQSLFMASLFKREDMQEKFSNQIMDLANHSFSEENVLKVLEEKIAESQLEQSYALKRGYTSTWANESTFDESRNHIRQFAKNRKDVVINDLAKNFNLSKEFYTINITGENGAKVWLNTLSALDKNTISNEYFVEHSVPIKAEAYSGYKFSYWLINGEKVYENETEINVNQAQNNQVNVELVLEKSDEFSNLQIDEVYTAGKADWIKLYNPNNFDIEIENLFLSDDNNNLKRFKIPTTTIKANEALTIVCKNNKDSSSLLKIQANFNLKAGETLILSDEDGKIIEKLVIPDLEKDQSYKRQSDGSFLEKEIS